MRGARGGRSCEARTQWQAGATALMFFTSVRVDYVYLLLLLLFGPSCTLHEGKKKKKKKKVNRWGEEE